MNGPRPRSLEGASAGRPLEGRRIALFRAADQVAELSSAIRALAGDVVSVPLVAVIGPADDGAALARALAGANGYDWVVVTSANGARAIAPLAAMAADERSWAVAAVGLATAGALADLGFAVEFVPGAADAAALAAELPHRGSDRVLAPLAELAGPGLASGLSERGFVVDRVEAYRLRAVDPLPEDLESLRSVDAVVFTSPSIVARYRACGLSPGRSAIISIGPRTTRSLRAAGLVPVHEASPHDGEGIVQALVASLDPASTS